MSGPAAAKPAGGREPPGDEGEDPRRRRSRGVAILFWFAGILLSLVALVALVVLVLLPWLGRRGDLNRIVESVIRSSLPDLDVRVRSLETRALSHLAITYIEGVHTEKENSFSFRSERVSMLYSPLQLWFGRVEDFVLTRPQLFLNLDVDVGQLFRMPELPAGSAGAGAPAADAGEFELGHFGIQEGELTLRYGGRDYRIEDLGLNVWGIGSREALTFRVRTRSLGAELQASGTALPGRSPGGRRIWSLRDVQMDLRGLELRRLRPLVAPLLPDLEGSGRLDFHGSAEGVWPERVSVRLETALAGAEVGGDTKIVDRGQVELALDASVVGELRRIEFAIDLSARGEVAGPETTSREAVELRLAGSFERDAGGGAIELDPDSHLRTRGLGTFALGGAVRSVLEEPRLELTLSTRDLDLATASQHALAGWLRPHLRELEGRLDLDLDVTGPLPSPRVAVRFEVARARVKLAGLPDLDGSARGSVAEVRDLDRGIPTLEGIDLAVSDLDLALVVELLGLDMESAALEGRLALGLRVPRLGPEGVPESLKLSLTAAISELALLEDAVATADATLTGALELEVTDAPESDRRRLRADIDLALDADELALGPAVMLLDEPLRLAGRVESDLPLPASPPASLRLRLDGFLGVPGIGTVGFRGSVGQPPGTSARDGADGADGTVPLDLEVFAREIDNEALLGTFLRDPFVDELSILEGATFAGTTGFTLRITGKASDPQVAGRVTMTAAGIRLPSIDTELARLALDLPLPLGERAPGSDGRGFIELGELRHGAVTTADLRLPLVLSAGRYRLEGGSVSAGLLGGTLTLRRLEVGVPAGEAVFDLSLKVSGVELARLTPLGGLDPIEGVVHADFRSFSLEGRRLAVDGFVEVNALGGVIRLEDVEVEHLGTPYMTFHLGSGTGRELDLLRLGEAFHLGVISGILQGSIENLVFLPGAISRFEIDLETVERPGVPQYISKDGVRSLRQIVSGPLSVVESVFSKFRYKRLGFRASLRNNRFRLRGKYVVRGIEYLMYSRWWQIPRIDIVNSLPQRVYDWRAIAQNLMHVIGAGAGREEAR